MNRLRRQRPPRRGILLLLVLSMLAFLSILVVTYVAFSSRSRRNAYALASREFRAVDNESVMENAMLTLLSGPRDNADGSDNTTNPFYGEDLLADIYGVTDHTTTSAILTTNMRDDGNNLTPLRRPMYLGGNFVQVPLDVGSLTTPSSTAISGAANANGNPVYHLDDALAGRILTMQAGPLANRSFRILRSTGNRDSGSSPPPSAQAFNSQHSVVIELDPDLVVTLPSGPRLPVDNLLDVNQPFLVATLFYDPGSNGYWGIDNNNDDGAGSQDDLPEAGWPGPGSDAPWPLLINGSPMNGGGVGYNGTNVAQSYPNPPGSSLAVPVAFQPNLSNAPNATWQDKTQYQGDADEPYDAADFQNWFLAHRYVDENGIARLTPSFHRPALINYLLNEFDLSSVSPQDLQAVVAAIRRATMRPLPFHPSQSPPTQSLPHTRFTGGNVNFALRSPNLIENPSSNAQMQRLSNLVDALVNGPWDVDNDGDSIPDSVWIDLGLPPVSSPEGKILRPLIAPLIEDLGGRIHMNAHGNVAQLEPLPGNANMPQYAVGANGPWGGDPANQAREVFRGLGYGPSEIILPGAPLVGSGGAPMHGASQLFTTAERVALLRERYRDPADDPALFANTPAPGRDGGIPTGNRNGGDDLENLLHGTRPGLHLLQRTALPGSGALPLPGTDIFTGGWGMSIDPWGRGGLGIHRTGQLFASLSGTTLEPFNAGATPPQPLLNESINDPYEMDPSGQLDGDSPFTLAELEVLFRNNPWAADELPPRLRELVANSAGSNSELARMVTTRSVSLDLPTAMMPVSDRQNQSVPLSAVLLARLGVNVNLPNNPTMAQLNAFQTRMTQANVEYAKLIAPELRRGNKLDINRPFGNGVDERGTTGRDDDGDGTVDEADERNGVIDEPMEVLVETNAYPQAPTTSGPVQSAFGGAAGDYRADQPPTAADPGGRQLFARNLYILMMSLTGQGYDFPVESNDGGSSLIDEADYKARRLAQWAVNVADYRDFDSIMTPFEFDTDLSDGSWDVDGDLTTSEADAAVVWGVEQPELLFSEVTALHDVRVRDSKNEQAGGTGPQKSDGMNPDEDTDSVRIPQGSLFMELYNPRARVNSDENHLAGVPHELYDVTGGNPQLDLGRMAPPPPASSGKPEVFVPVWRIAISEPHYENIGNEKSAWDPQTLRGDLPDTASFDPNNPDELGTDPPSGPSPPPATLEMQRFVFFAPFEPGPGDGDEIPSVDEIAAAVSDVQPNEIFHSISSPPDPPFSAGVDRTLEPSQYLVLAPRVTTHLGSFTYGGPNSPTGPSHQRFRIATAANPITGGGNQLVGLAHYDLIDDNNQALDDVTTRNTNIQSRPALPLLIGTPRPSGWDPAIFEGGYVGMNVSEPMPQSGNYYTEPRERLNSTMPEYPLTDAYLDYDDINGTTARDFPEDMVAGRPIANLTADLASGSDDPFLGTVPRYCSAFLQRLADPTRPYDDVTNPYMTVDWMSIDLTVFSGEEDPSKVEDNASPGYATQTRQRTGKTGISGQSGVLFSYETNEADFDPAALAPLPPVAANYFQVEFVNSFNHLNEGSPEISTEWSSFITGASNADRGQPDTPFAMHHWLNRPFATPYELMLVPACSQGRLFEELTLADTSESPYLPVPPGGGAYAATNPSQYPQFRASFGHLLNFFQSSTTEDNSAHFYRLFEFVGTNPPFRGEVDLIAPGRVAPISNTSDAAQTQRTYSQNVFGSLFQPPLNYKWDGRREGEINLNTLAGYPVWMGLMYGHLTNNERNSAPGIATGDLNYRTFMSGRRGYTVPVPAPANPLQPIVDAGGNVRPRPYNYDTGRFNQGFPTEYAGALRTGLDADLAPDVHGNGAPTEALRRAGIEGTLAQPAIDPATMNNQDYPAFVRDAVTDAWKDTERSAAMRYQTLTRMPNLTTNQSHIFLVRLTLGYFEFDPSSGLGREYKADLGQQKRYKATFIIDRSIPVGYEPGSDTNVRDTILFSRMEE